MSELIRDEFMSPSNSDRLLMFLRDFRTSLISTFDEPMDTESSWLYVSGTDAWYKLLFDASSEYLPEINALYRKVEWWGRNALNRWVVDCAVMAGFIKPKSAEFVYKEVGIDMEY